MQNGDSRKRSYTTPLLTMHGTLEQLTKQLIEKKQGLSDGFIFQGITLVNATS
jgi:hypothetical protein